MATRSMWRQSLRADPDGAAIGRKWTEVHNNCGLGGGKNIYIHFEINLHSACDSTGLTPKTTEPLILSETSSGWTFSALERTGSPESSRGSCWKKRSSACTEPRGTHGLRVTPSTLAAAAAFFFARLLLNLKRPSWWIMSTTSIDPQVGWSGTASLRPLGGAGNARAASAASAETLRASASACFTQARWLTS